MPLKASDFAPSGAPTGEASIPTNGVEDQATGARAALEGVDALQGSPDEPYGVSKSVTPAGLEIYYQAGPKRLYRVRQLARDVVAQEWIDDPVLTKDPIEVPSVTTVNDVIDKSGALTWWGQGVGGLGALRLLWEFGGDGVNEAWALLQAGSFDDARKVLCDHLTKHKISTNHVRDEAGDRGVNVHGAFEQWAADQRITPQPAVYPEHERGYIQGLANFLRDLTAGEPTEIEAELMVASLRRKFAGRYDLQLELQKPCEMVTRTYPIRKDKIEEIPAGKYRFDLKTSKGVWDTHYLQSEAYEGASIECGYGPTDYRGIVRVTPDGKYELFINQLKNEKCPWSYDDFLVVRDLFHILKETKR